VVFQAKARDHSRLMADFILHSDLDSAIAGGETWITRPFENLADG
jgi:hypothetical protein